MCIHIELLYSFFRPSPFPFPPLKSVMLSTITKRHRKSIKYPHTQVHVHTLYAVSCGDTPRQNTRVSKTADNTVRPIKTYNRQK